MTVPRSVLKSKLPKFYVRIGNNELGYSEKHLIKKVIFKVKCFYKKGHRKFKNSVCRMNSKLLAYYIKTGSLIEGFVNKGITR